MQDHDPLILTLRMDPNSFGRLDRLRRAHFPPERNFLDAHLTLFHALPGGEAPAIHVDLDDFCRTLAPLTLGFDSVRSLGRGVAVDVRCPELVRRRQALAGRWSGWLRRQDSQKLRPHVTVQNKVEPWKARALYESLSAGWEPFQGVGEGLSLWHYRGGPWEAAGYYPFAGQGQADRG